ncbi:ABC transporter permease [Bacteroides coprosuis]|uniref:ABC transporter permease n=1 Tax=Bacteroides coprosuis TaxID=151276 RepID=UPI001E07E457|nr:ABC transporter permease [Bacteroides coprosuis]HJD92283.1 ABC transporter permease [Bacteroides coprosuis]
MNTISLISMLRAEFYKTRRNRGFLLLLSFPLIIIFIAILYLLYHSNEVHTSPISPWAYYLANDTLPFIGFFYPIVVALFCYSLCDMEYKNNSIKQLFSLPISKAKIYFTKIIFMFIALLTSLLLAYGGFFLAGYLLGHLAPSYGFQDFNYLVFKQVTKFFIVSGVGFSAIMMIQYFLSLIFKNFIIPVAIGGFGVIFGMIVKIWDYLDYVPHATAINTFFGMMDDPLAMTLWGKASTINACYILAFGFLSFLFFTRRLGKRNR